MHHASAERGAAERRVLALLKPIPKKLAYHFSLRKQIVYGFFYFYISLYLFIFNKK